MKRERDTCIPWDDEHEPTREEVAVYLHGQIWEARYLDDDPDRGSFEEITYELQAVLRALSDVIYQQRRNFPDGTGDYEVDGLTVYLPEENPFQVAADARVDVLLEEIADSMEGW